MKNVISLFEQCTIRDFCNKYNVKKSLLKENIHYFRYFCFKMNFFMKNIVLPKIKKESLFEAVFIEFREFPHVEFLLRNAVLKLGSKWMHTIICGNKNYSMMEKIVQNISPFIRIIKLNVENMTQSEYSRLLMSKDFWNLLKGSKIFVHQEDSLIFKDNIDEFIEYDYIGAPFPKKEDDTPNSVGNGGLSLRTKSIMLDIISKFDFQKCQFNSSTLRYMKHVHLEYPPEDVYFSKCMQENSIGLVADWNTAYSFSSESIYNRNSFAGHKFWISEPKLWINHLKQLFQFNYYSPKSDLDKYINYLKKPLSINRNKEIANAFDIDIYFFCKVNNLECTKVNSSLEYFKKIGMNGFIYHPKQLKNYFSEVTLFRFMKNIYITTEMNMTPITIQDFANKYLYNSSFDFLASLLITKKYSCLNNNYDTLFLVFIGNEKIGLDLLKSIVNHKKINNKFNISFCFNNEEIMNSPKIRQLIKQNFDYYAIYKCKEMGTDITPTLLMYNAISETQHFEHIYKFHTKSITPNCTELTSYLLSMSLNQLIREKRNSCNCIGNPKHYTLLKDDIFNNKLKQEFASKMNLKMEFVAGTIFYSEGKVFDKVLDFIKQNNYRSYFLNNLYENNSINDEYSPIHFIERLFGVILL